MICPGKNSGFTLVESLTVIIIIFILMGMMTVGMINLRQSEETTNLTGRTQSLYQGLQLYYTDHKTFPSANPAQLNTDLAKYVTNPAAFVNPYNTPAGTDPLNMSYVSPNLNDPNSYVLSYDCVRDPSKVVVLFANGDTDVAIENPIYFNDVATTHGTSVSDGTIRFANGSTVELPATAPVTIVQSFQTSDGTPFDIVKCNPDGYGTMTATAQSADVITVSTDAGLVFVRQGVADIRLEPGQPQDEVTVTSYQGEVIFCSKETERGAAPAYNGLPANPAGPVGATVSSSNKGSISGQTLQDLTGNGLTHDDIPMSGVTIKLYRDKNNDGKLTTSDGSAVATIVTATTTGAYSVSNLAAGRYFVQELVPTGYVRTNPELSDTHTIVITASQAATDVDFANFLKPTWSGRVTNVTYLINGTTTVTDLRGNTDQGDLIQVGFTITAGAPVQLSLVSYVAPDNTFIASNAGRQIIFDGCTGYFAPGTYSLWVENPDFWVENPHCYYQVDFVCGPPINHFGPANSNIFYSAQGRLISADNDGLNAPGPYTPENLGGSSANQTPSAYRTFSRGIQVPKGYWITGVQQ